MNAACSRRIARGRPVERRQAARARPVPESLAWIALTAALALATTAARAGKQASLDHCTLEDARTAEQLGGASGANAPAAAAMAVELAHPLPAATVERPAPHALPLTGWSPLRFVDHLELGERIRSLRRVRLLRLWDDARLTVFLGVDRAGVAGLHIQQQDPGEPLSFDRNVGFDRSAVSAQLPPLRAVPLDSR